jgi:hypothetical protein
MVLILQITQWIKMNLSVFALQVSANLHMLEALRWNISSPYTMTFSARGTAWFKGHSTIRPLGEISGHGYLDAKHI